MKPILEKFTSKKEGSELSKIYFADGYSYASNQHIMVKAPGVVEGSIENDKFSDVFKTNMVAGEKVADLNLSDLKKFLDPFRTEPKYSKMLCIDCDGDGTLECDLGHDHECEDCNGEGEVDDISKFIGMGFEKLFTIQLYSKLFNPHYLDQLTDLSDYAEVFKVPGRLQYLFKMKEYDAVIMPKKDEILHLLPDSVEEYQPKTVQL